MLLDRLWDGTSAALSDSMAVAAMGSGAQMFGGLAIRRAEPGHLTPDDIGRLRLIAEAFANVLARQKGEDDRVRAELEAQRSRAELAHVSRQRSMGELTASLAHELNQPLTGILGNAQAARRMLGMPSLDLDELKATLDDIIADEQARGRDDSQDPEVAAQGRRRDGRDRLEQRDSRGRLAAAERRRASQPEPRPATVAASR